MPLSLEVFFRRSGGDFTDSGAPELIPS